MIRHWRQIWDPKAEFVFTRSSNSMGDRPVSPGDPVTKEIRDRIGMATLRAWWRAGFIALKDGPGSPKALAAQETPKPAPKKRGRPRKNPLPEDDGSNHDE